MSTSLLNRTRKLNKILQRTGDTPVVFNELCDLLMDVLESNVYIISTKGKVLGTSYFDVSGSPVITDDKTNEQYFPPKYNKSLLEITDTLYNITQEDLIKLFENEIDSYSKFATIVPILGSGNRLGTLLLARSEVMFNDDDLVLVEYASTVVGMEIIRSDRLILEKNARDKAIVQISIETLSYSELEAVIHIFKELDGQEGLLVASKVADRVGITRSVIVNALRKLESAGVINSRSLGMKGTHIKILNEYLIDELYKYDK
ncbi:MAG: GTP-sensing pleiotropic transcriptional regulator CodY [Clostridiales bacterium]|nr:GTP-sensing pleiotropic transcriptional regulator CodY [Clostridiales bacterium]